MSIPSFATVLLLSLALTTFRPRGVKYRSFMAGIVMGLLPALAWSLRQSVMPLSPQEMVFEGWCVMLLSVFFTASGNSWGADVRTPMMVVAETISYARPETTPVAAHYLEMGQQMERRTVPAVPVHFSVRLPR